MTISVPKRLHTIAVQSKKRSTLIAVLAAALPMLLLGLLIYRYGVNVPFWDQWEVVPLLQKLNEGTLGFSDLWQQHNEHRILFPRIVILTLAQLTGWYIPAELFASYVIAAIGFGIMFMLLKKSVGKKHGLFVIFALLMSAWYFSPIQAQNWLWGWQIEWFMCITAVIATVYALYKLSQKQTNTLLLLAIGSAFIAMFSLGSGILVWVVGLLMMLIYKMSKKYVYIWAVSGGAASAVYYYGYTKPPHHPSLTTAIEQPLETVGFFLATLGRPFSGEAVTALLAGILVSALLVVLIPVSIGIYRKHKQELIAWYGLIAYGLLGIAMTAVSRVGFGISAAMPSRYTAFSLLVITGMLGILALYFGSSRPSPRLATAYKLFALVVVSVPLLMFSYVSGVNEMIDRSRRYKTIQHCTKEANPTPECLLMTYPNEALARERLEYLKRNDYAGY